jgi:hypothetical protein
VPKCPTLDLKVLLVIRFWDWRSIEACCASTGVAYTSGLGFIFRLIVAILLYIKEFFGKKA